MPSILNGFKSRAYYNPTDIQRRTFTEGDGTRGKVARGAWIGNSLHSRMIDCGAEGYDISILQLTSLVESFA